MSYKINVSLEVLPDEILSTLEPVEAEGAAEVSTRKDTTSIWVTDIKGKVICYFVFGWDKGDMVAVYYARAMVPVLGPMMMKQFFGVTQVLGVPMRVHADSIREIKAKARMFGATFAAAGKDSDGILQGIFSDVE
jgi:hypothetical protein